MPTTAIRSFYKVSIPVENQDSIFNKEYNMIVQTVESVNSLNSIYKAKRAGSMGPSTHNQQDLYRAMLIFACAGLDIFLKQLITEKLPKLIAADKNSREEFKKYILRGLSKDTNKLLNTVALALVDSNPKEIFLNEYIKKITGDSLQSLEQLFRVIEASGLDRKKNNIKGKRTATRRCL